MEMDKLEQENTAATVFSYLIRGLSNGNKESVKAELVQKMTPIKELYSLSDEIYPLYIDQCMEKKKFLKVQDAIEAFGSAIDAGKIKSSDERIIMAWIGEIMRQNKTTGNVKTKRR
ncbi:hypothetical protein [Methanocella arvoryzae]|uniref:Uncharacterized protein n=1 Tax=Methanocella arvoryzae (strain DSM 22066 / NBRC 105507 / MRE50) TaxID=351160 RepID=Q0W5P5_METAR|nr:hypothetical protein [Methanocella arvoryzae]CAJ36298.1 hypothetical protein RCIX956 [Methanocella arvoryzae MRE50]